MGVGGVQGSELVGMVCPAQDRTAEGATQRVCRPQTSRARPWPGVRSRRSPRRARRRRSPLPRRSADRPGGEVVVAQRSRKERGLQAVESVEEIWSRRAKRRLRSRPSSSPPCSMRMASSVCNGARCAARTFPSDGRSRGRRCPCRAPGRRLAWPGLVSELARARRRAELQPEGLDDPGHGRDRARRSPSGRHQGRRRATRGLHLPAHLRDPDRARAREAGRADAHQPRHRRRPAPTAASRLTRFTPGSRASASRRLRQVSRLPRSRP